MNARAFSGPARRGAIARVARGALLLAMLASPSLLAAGCGGGSKAPPVASLGTTTPTSTSSSSAATAPPVLNGGSSGSSSGISMVVGGGAGRADVMKFSECMRAHGVANFPDPDAQGAIQFSGDANSPQFQSAQTACQKLLPTPAAPSPAQQQQFKKAALANAACMRSHGVPNFPDPTFGAGGAASIKISASSGIDPNSAIFQAAMKACAGTLPKGGAKLQAGQAVGG